MAPSPPRLRVLSVGGNAVSAFLSWRLQATNSCDVTLVWKSGFEAVSQYGVSFKSKTFGNERFKPRYVVRTPEEAGSREPAYDYVILCIKALPDIYDLAGVIESVVTPQHTCILVNTTNTIGVESHLEHRFPTNVILSLVSNVDIAQTGASDFEHTASTELWVGPATKNPSIPASIQKDMASALAITLSSGQMDCKVSENIRQQQYDRMIGPIAFHPASVMFETPQHSKLLEKVGVRQLVSDVIDELVALATSQGCSFPDNFKQTTIDKMSATTADAPSTMYQDFMARRPMEIETYLGSPIKLATESETKIPRIETLYAILHHLNTTNQNRPPKEPSSPGAPGPPPPRLSSAPPRASVNGMRGRGHPGPGMPPPRRGPPSMASAPRQHPNGHPPPPGPHRGPKENSATEELPVEEFSHLMLYEDAVDDDIASQNGGYPPSTNGGGPPHSHSEYALKERELMLRQRELRIREQEMSMRRGGNRRMSSGRDAFGAEDEDYFDPMSAQAMPAVDADNLDMMSMTSRRNRKAPSSGQFRKNPEVAMNNSRPPSTFGRHFGLGRNRKSARPMEDIPGTHDSLLDNPMMAYSSNRFANVDRKEMHADSRANSMTTAQMQDYRPPPGPPHPGPPSRRTSQSPGQGLHPGRGRPATGHDSIAGPPNGMNHPGGRPSPPGAMRSPVPRHPPGHGNALAPQQVEQHAGMNGPYPSPGTPI